jgi:hypothetical protein
MSDVVRIIVLIFVFLITVYINIKLTDHYHHARIIPVLEQQSLINQDLYNKLNELQQTADYLEFSLDVNNRLVEELLSEQIQKKGDE